MERVVLGKRERTMVGFRWSGHEPKELNDVELAERCGAIWEGDELVHYDMDSLNWQIERVNEDDYISDND